MKFEDDLRTRLCYEDSGGSIVVRMTREERDALADAVLALRDLLDYSERAHSGDPSLSSESYYIERDFSRLALACLNGLA